jgi:hypothetical protein
VERGVEGEQVTDPVDDLDEAAGSGTALPDPDGPRDPVDEMVEESFPASDPPSGWAGEDPRDVPGAAG